uniref:Immunoglobulin domain-containing protein n=1 Tax=Cyprinus carpio TaxID=7962 RepID=A0A8C2C4T7_CYPCA
MKIVFSMILSMFVTDGVFGVDPDGVKTVIEGGSLTLQTDFIEMQKDGLTEWKVNNTNIATINKGTGKVEYSDDILMMMFSGRLNLDHTGFLTIWNIRIKHSGEYKVESISSVGTKSKTFKVIVKESPLKSVEDKDEIKALSATKGNSETLHTETELQEHDLILWRFGAEGSLIAKSDTEDSHTSFYDGDDGRFRGRLEMDSKTGSLTITDLETEHTGEFRLKIYSDRRIVFKRFIVTVSVPGLSKGAIAGICVAVLLLVAAAVTSGVVIYFRHKISELKKLIPKISERLDQLPKISKDLEQLLKLFKQLSEISEKKESPKINEKELVKISEKLMKMSDVCEKELPKISEHLEKLREEKISERLREISEKLKEMFEGKKPKQQPQLRADVTKEEIMRPEEEKDEWEASIYVEDTAISLASGRTHGGSFKLKEGKNVVIINENAGVCAHGSDGHTGNELKEMKAESSVKGVNEETALMSQNEEDGEAAV